MSNEKTLQPALRFSGCDGDWKSTSLADVVDVRSGRDYKHLNQGSIPVYGTGGYMLSVDKALSYNEDAIGIGRKGTIDRPFVLRAPFWTVDTLFYAVPKLNNDLQFTYSLFQKVNWKDKDESTGVPSLSKVAINGIPVISCSLREQTKIGDYFQNIDQQLKLYQYKHTKLQQLKKAMLSKMFPKAGAKVPEMRFAGFSGDWETKQFDRVVDFYSGLTYSPKSIVKSNGTLVLRSSNIQNGQLTFNDNVFVHHNVVNSINVEAGDIIVVVRNGSRTLIGKHAAVLTSMPNTVIGAFMTGIRTNQSKFINALLDTPLFQKAVEKNLGATINQITTGAFKAMEFEFPIDQNEQTKIGNYFYNLDRLIALQQQHINKLKNIKQACLEKMFV
ncbi:restriction endonuclease subunit S [Xenorhabdus japonica]|uniref:Type I restriction enzyme, S subunit n=1 Tax=Xenorhabdus japonica TaxID=53341 RepID=A0A1I4ZS84_9GAMM|nr:restriction endonuclease subunit S [Xenorhabdus japonica]SFN53135.1 type I restriction enzyme, S subunit [Xenorhabdus japonica]